MLKKLILFNVILLILFVFFLGLFGIKTEHALAQNLNAFQSSSSCEQYGDKTVKFNELVTGMGTDSFVVESPQKLVLLSGARFEVRQDPKFGKILQPISPAGAPGTALICRCIQGFSGGCGVTPGGAFAYCGGTCTHAEVPSETTFCRFMTPGLAAPS